MLALNFGIAVGLYVIWFVGVLLAVGIFGGFWDIAESGVIKGIIALLLIEGGAMGLHQYSLMESSWPFGVWPRIAAGAAGFVLVHGILGLLFWLVDRE